MSSHEGTWFELQTDSHGAGLAERYRDKAAAEQAATAQRRAVVSVPRGAPGSDDS
jgi:hypothetical protein